MKRRNGAEYPPIPLHPVRGGTFPALETYGQGGRKRRDDLWMEGGVGAVAGTEGVAN